MVDTLGLDAGRRLAYLELARQSRLPAVAVLFDTDPALCRQRNRTRAQPVPAAVLDTQLRRMPEVAAQLAAEGWDAIVSPAAVAVEPAHSPGSRDAARKQEDRPAQLEFILQISRFGWDDDPAGWLRRWPLPPRRRDSPASR